MTTDELFPATRATDPETSHEAAEKVSGRVPAIRNAVLKTITYRLRFRPFTLEDVVAEYRARQERDLVPKATDSSVRTRVSELMTEGVVRDTEQTVLRDGHRRRMRLLELA